MYLACTFLGPLVYLGLSFCRSLPSPGGGLLTVAFHARGWSGRAGDSLVLPADAVLAVTGDGRAPGGRQVAPLVFSAWDSATRNAATAVLNSGGNVPPAPPASCQVRQRSGADVLVYPLIRAILRLGQ